MLRRCTGALACVLGAALSAGAAHATPIGPNAFGATALVESFEGIAVGTNVGPSPFGNIVQPGMSADFTFASGVTLTAPVPNPGLFSNGAFVHDLALPGAINQWGSSGNVDDAGDVPDPFGAPSSSYLGIFDNLGAGSASIRLDFASDMLRVGAFVAGVGGSSIRIDAYDGAGNLLETVILLAPSVAQWGGAGSFLGVERTEGIRSLVFTGVDFGLDGLTFEAPIPVPEPTTAVLVSVGLLGLALASRGFGRA